jgi:YD repeat-containing protein
MTTKSSDKNDYDVIETQLLYDPLNHITVKSTPFRSNTDATLEWVCTQTDASNRVTLVSSFKGSSWPRYCTTSDTSRTGLTSTVYNANVTTVTEVAETTDKVRAQTVDSLGRLTEVVEDPGTASPHLNYSTTYSYDTLGNLTGVSQGTQTRTFVYSSLGRLKSATNPESGTLDYTYNDSGDLSTRTDARSFTTTMTYDAMHRILTKTYSGDGDVTPDVTYSYYDAGSAAPNIGQLKSIVSSAATVTYGEYDVLGRMGSNTQAVNGNAYTFGYTYRLNDTIAAIVYPSGKILSYDADDSGRTSKISTSSKTYTDLTSVSLANRYAADGRLAQMKLGNDLWETHDYHTPGTPTYLQLGTGTGTSTISDRLKIEYDYSGDKNNGNLLIQKIYRPSQTWEQTYTYDSLNRLHTAVETSGFSETYDYDRYGNRWYRRVRTFMVLIHTSLTMNRISIRVTTGWRSRADTMRREI